MFGGGEAQRVLKAFEPEQGLSPAQSGPGRDRQGHKGRKLRGHAWETGGWGVRVICTHQLSLRGFRQEEEEVKVRFLPGQEELQATIAHSLHAPRVPAAS